MRPQNIVNKILNEIRTFMGGMNQDNTFSTVPKNQYIEAESIKLTEPDPEALGAVKVSIGNELVVDLKEINIANDDDDYKAWRIAFDLTADGISHEFKFYSPPTTLLHTVTISGGGGNATARYTALKSAFNTAIGAFGTGSIYIDATPADKVVHAGFKFYGNSDYTVTEKINSIDVTTYIIKEYLGTANNGTFGELQTYDFLGDLFHLTTNGNVLRLSVARRDDSDGSWTNVIVFQTKMIKIAKSFINLVDLDLELDANERISSYFAAEGILPRVIYTHQQATYEEMSDFIYNENPAYIETGNPNGYFFFDSVDKETRLQVLENFAQVGFVSEQSGGSLTSGDKMYAVRQKIGDTVASGFSIFSDPINVMSRSLSDTRIYGDAGGTATSKSITLTITGLNPQLYDKFDLVVVENTDGAITAKIVDTFNINSITQNVTHSNYANAVDISVAEIVTQQVLILDAANLRINRNKLFLQNVTVQTDYDLAEWAKTITITTEINNNAIQAQGNVNTTIGEYQIPTNVNGYMGYMDQETYRFGIMIFFKSGFVSSPYFIRDYKINPSNHSLTTVDGSGVPTNVNVFFPQFGVDFNQASFTNQVAFDQVYGYSIVRLPCIPEILATGYVQHEVVPTGGYYTVGSYVIGLTADPFGATSSNRRLLAFLSPDLSFNQQTITALESDQLILWGQMSNYNNVVQSRVDGIHVDYCNLREWNHVQTANTVATLDIDPTGEYVNFNTAGTVSILSTLPLTSTIAASSTISPGSAAGLMTAGSLALGLKASNFAVKRNAVTDYGFYYVQYYRPNAGKYGDESQGSYISTGYFNKVGSGTSYTDNVFGGDVFNQKTFMKFCNFANYLVNDYRRVGISIYTQNRANYQMRYFTNAVANNLDYPYTTTDLVQWLSGATTAGAETNEGQFKYSTSYTPLNNFQTFAAFNQGTFVTSSIKQASAVRYSLDKLTASSQDSYRVFLPLNVKFFPQIYGAGTGIYIDENYLVLMFEGAVIMQGVDLQALGTTQSQQTFILGDSTVLGSQERIITNYGCPLKTGSVNYLSSTGKYYTVWYNHVYKKLFRRGVDGIRDLGEQNLMQSFLYHNNDLVSTTSNLAIGYDIFSNEVLFCVNATVAAATLYNNTNPYTAGDIVLVQPNAGMFTYYQALINIDANDPDLPNTPAGLFQKWKIYRQSNYLLAFNEKINNFSTFYPYSTRLFIPYKNTFLTSFTVPNSVPTAESFLYEHNRGSVLQWYTAAKIRDAYIKTVVNDVAEIFKTMIRVWIKCKNIPSYLHIRGNNGSKTFAEPADFQQKREFWWVNSKNDATITVSNPTGINTGFTQRTSGETMTTTVFFDTENKMSEVSVQLFEKPRIFNQ